MDFMVGGFQPMRCFCGPITHPQQISAKFDYRHLSYFRGTAQQE